MPSIKKRPEKILMDYNKFQLWLHVLHRFTCTHTMYNERHCCTLWSTTAYHHANSCFNANIRSSNNEKWQNDCDEGKFKIYSYLAGKWDTFFALIIIASWWSCSIWCILLLMYEFQKQNILKLHLCLIIFIRYLTPTDTAKSIYW